MDTTSPSAKPASPTPDGAPRREARAGPSIPFDMLGANLTYGVLDRIDAGIIAALAPAHPRAFWALAKRHLFETPCAREYAPILAQACARDERLLRLGLAAARAESRIKNRTYSANDMPLRFLIMALALPGQSDAWRATRIAENSSMIYAFPASSCFMSMAAAARSGHLAATEQLAAMMPDKRLGALEAQKYQYGTCGFVRSNMGSRSGQAWARASAASEACGRPPGEGPPGSEAPLNGLYWISVRHHALRDSDPAAAERWGRAGADMIERGLEVEEAHESIGLAMGCAPMRKALIARRPVLGNARFQFFDRETATLASLLLAAPADVAEICAYDETGSACRPPMNVSSRGVSSLVSPVPAAALALLAGHAPDPAWMGLGADRLFNIPKAIFDAAKAGTLTAFDLDVTGLFRFGKRHSIDTLAAALGKPPQPRAPAAKKAPENPSAPRSAKPKA